MSKVFMGKQSNIHPVHYSAQHTIYYQIKVNHCTHILKVSNNIIVVVVIMYFSAYSSANLFFIQFFHAQWSMVSNIPSSVETC